MNTKMNWTTKYNPQIKKYHSRKQTIIENPHNQPFKPEKKGNYEDV